VEVLPVPKYLVRPIAKPPYSPFILLIHKPSFTDIIHTDNLSAPPFKKNKGPDFGAILEYHLICKKS
jgi:hypothetical protein